MENELRAQPVRFLSEQADAIALQTASSEVVLGRDAYRIYQSLAEKVRDHQSVGTIAEQIGVSPRAVERATKQFIDAGLLCRAQPSTDSVTGLEFFESTFSELLPYWLSEAFSHPFWQRMLEGRGSKLLFAGWLFELYHYTKNANRHMPLSCAYTDIKPIKRLRAKHYVEEWNHYHYFGKSLRALGFSRADVDASEPLPMTQEMSNFMRQAARDDILAYSVCSAVLEGTTVGEENYDGYYQRCVELYGLPRDAVKPIYDHLDLDKQYEHSDLFRDILSHVPMLSNERQVKILSYGEQLAEHIWLWTDEIERYYGNTGNAVPRTQFSLLQD